MASFRAYFIIVVIMVYVAIFTKLFERFGQIKLKQQHAMSNNLQEISRSVGSEDEAKQYVIDHRNTYVNGTKVPVAEKQQQNVIVDSIIQQDERFTPNKEMSNHETNTTNAPIAMEELASKTYLLDGKLVSYTNKNDVSRQLANESLAGVCKMTATPDKELVVSLIGSGVHDVCMNFYYSSILKHNINNMLFIATDPVACQQIESELMQPVACFVAYEDTASEKQSIYGSLDFNRKCLKRASIVLDIIKLGYTVLASDIDIVFLNNPLPVLRKLCSVKMCDVAIQWNSDGQYNGGFLYVRPTAASEALYTRLLRYGEHHHSDDQRSLNSALKRDKHIRVVTLDEKMFPTGPAFFVPGTECPEQKRYNESIIVHNNFLVSPIAKIQRLKDCGLWYYDGLDRYYTSTSRKYLQYSNEKQLGNNLQAVLNGLVIGHILDRTFILPATKSKLFYYALSHGNEKHDYYLESVDKYREPVFLDHPLVPAVIKDSRSVLYCISRDANSTNCELSTVVLQNNDQGGGPSEQDIHKWFRHVNASILVITPLENDLPTVNYTEILGDFEHAFDGQRLKHTAITLNSLA